MTARANYIISAQDATKDAIRNIEKNFRSMDSGIRSAVRGINATFGILAGVGIKNMFRASLEATADAAGKNSEFAQTLDEIKKSARDLMVPKTGLPGVTENMQELARTLKDPAVQSAADALFSSLVRGGTATVNLLAQTATGLRILLSGAGGDAAVDIDNKMRQLQHRIDQYQNVTPGSYESKQKSLLQAQMADLQARFWQASRGPVDGGLQEINGDIANATINAHLEEQAAKFDAAGTAAKAYKETVDELAKASAKLPGEFFAGSDAAMKQTLENEEQLRQSSEDSAEFFRGMYDKYQNTIRDSNAEAVRQAQDAAQATRDAWADVAFTGLFEGMDALKRRWKQTMQVMVAEAVGSGILEMLRGGSFGGGFWSGLGSAVGGLKSLFGFANGGDFTVGGSGGIDSKVVAFRATPGERVSVRRPDQGGASSAPVIHFSIDARGAQEGVAAQVQRAIAQAAPMIVDASRRAMKDDLSRRAIR